MPTSLLSLMMESRSSTAAPPLKHHGSSVSTDSTSDTSKGESAAQALARDASLASKNCYFAPIETRRDCDTVDDNDVMLASTPIEEPPLDAHHHVNGKDSSPIPTPTASNRHLSSSKWMQQQQQEEAATMLQHLSQSSSHRVSPNAAPATSAPVVINLACSPLTSSSAAVMEREYNRDTWRLYRRIRMARSAVPPHQTLDADEHEQQHPATVRTMNKVISSGDVTQLDQAVILMADSAQGDEDNRMVADEEEYDDELLFDME